MKTIFQFTTFAMGVLALAGSLLAQNGGSLSNLPVYPIGGWGYGFYGGYHASTLEEGVLRGWGAAMAGAGQANYLNSLAAINYQEAYERYLANRERMAETYFRLKAINQAAREARRPQRLSAEQYAELARKQAPERLSERQYDRTMGRLNWPAPLLDEKFAPEREELTRLFQVRSPGEFGPSTTFYGQVRRLTGQLEAKLKEKLPELSPAEYMAAKNFLLSLSYEAQQPMIGRGLASVK
jgi:hypothetical protein